MEKDTIQIKTQYSHIKTDYENTVSHTQDHAKYKLLKYLLCVVWHDNNTTQLSLNTSAQQTNNTIIISSVNSLQM